MKYKIYLMILFLPVIFLVLVVHACKHDLPLVGMDTVCFDSQVLPIFTSNCAKSGCHSSGGGERLQLTDYDLLRKEVTPFHSSQSRLYQAITAIWGNPMPPDHALSEEQRTIIRVWIDQGALHTTCPGGTVIVPPSSDTVPYLWACFQRDIQPVLNSSCAISGCHDAITHQQGLNLSTYAAARSIVVPNYPGESTLYQVITGNGENMMPPSPYNPLQHSQIDSIYSWISLGALNANCGDICDSAKVTFAAKVWPIFQNSCAGCHSGTSASKGIHIENYNDVVTLVNNGLLENVIHQVSPYPLMPPGNPLSTCRIRTIEIWVAAGTPNN